MDNPTHNLTTQIVLAEKNDNNLSDRIFALIDAGVKNKGRALVFETAGEKIHCFTMIKDEKHGSFSLSADSNIPIAVYRLAGVDPRQGEGQPGKLNINYKNQEHCLPVSLNKDGKWLEIDLTSLLA